MSAEELALSWKKMLRIATKQGYRETTLKNIKAQVDTWEAIAAEELQDEVNEKIDQEALRNG